MWCCFESPHLWCGLCRWIAKQCCLLNVRGLQSKKKISSLIKIKQKGNKSYNNTPSLNILKILLPSLQIVWVSALVDLTFRSDIIASFLFRLWLQVIYPSTGSPSPLSMFSLSLPLLFLSFLRDPPQQCKAKHKLGRRPCQVWECLCRS